MRQSRTSGSVGAPVGNHPGPPGPRSRLLSTYHGLPHVHRTWATRPCLHRLVHTPRILTRTHSEGGPATCSAWLSPFRTRGCGVWPIATNGFVSQKRVCLMAGSPSWRSAHCRRVPAPTVRTWRAITGREASTRRDAARPSAAANDASRRAAEFAEVDSGRSRRAPRLCVRYRRRGRGAGSAAERMGPWRWRGVACCVTLTWQIPALSARVRCAGPCHTGACGGAPGRARVWLLALAGGLQ